MGVSIQIMGASVQFMGVSIQIIGIKYTDIGVSMQIMGVKYTENLSKYTDCGSKYTDSFEYPQHVLVERKNIFNKKLLSRGLEYGNCPKFQTIVAYHKGQNKQTASEEALRLGSDKDIVNSSPDNHYFI